MAKKPTKEFVGRKLRGQPTPIALVDIDGEQTYVQSINEYGYLPEITTELRGDYRGEGNKEFLVAEDEDAASDAIKHYWDDLAQDPRELTTMIGEETIVNNWLNGVSFDDFVDLVVQDGLGHNLASHDGQEHTIKVLEIYDADRWGVTGLDEGAEGLAFRTS